MYHVEPKKYLSRSDSRHSFLLAGSSNSISEVMHLISRERILMTHTYTHALMNLTGMEP
jgi:hypothetical protein